MILLDIFLTSGTCIFILHLWLVTVTKSSFKTGNLKRKWGDDMEPHRHTLLCQHHAKEHKQFPPSVKDEKPPCRGLGGGG